VHRTTHKLVKHMVQRQKVTLEYVNALHFDALTAFLNDKSVIAATRGALQRVHFLVTCLHGSPPRSLAPENVNVRVVLAGFMLGFRPTQVFETMTPAAEAVQASAIKLLTCFHRICTAVLLPDNRRKHFGKKMDYALSKQLSLEIYDFLRLFKIWKAPDELRLVVRIKNALFELYRNKHNAAPGDVAAEFESQIARLRAKLLRIGGEEEVARLDEDVQKMPEMKTGRLTNEQLAHELLLDPRYQMPDEGYVFGTVRCTAEYRAIRARDARIFWQLVQEDLARQCYARALRVLEEVRDGLHELDGACGINEVIDLDFIRARMVVPGAYTAEDAQSLVQSTVQVVLRVCEPARKTETEQMPVPTSLAKGLEFLMNRVNVLRTDSANRHLRNIVTTVQESGFEYERDKFRDKVRAKQITPTRTLEWITAAAASAEALTTTRARVAMHTNAVLSLLRDRNAPIPETLLLDRYRIDDLRDEFDFLIKAKTLLTLMSMERLPGAPITDALKERAAARERLEAVLSILEPALEFDLSEFAIPPAYAALVANEFGETEGPVRSLMRLQLERQLRAPSSAVPTTVMGRRIQTFVALFTKVTLVNRMVHGHFYDAIINGTLVNVETFFSPPPI
jgi:hypothetical protein